MSESSRQNELPAGASSPPALPRGIHAVLGGVRRRMRRYALLRGAAIVATAMGAAFAASLVVDYALELPRWMRAVVIVAVGAGLAGLVARYLAGVLRVPLGDRRLAVLLERRFPELGDSLLTAVELTESSGATDSTDAGPARRNMEAHTCEEAGRRLAGVNVALLFDRRPLLTAGLLAACAVGLVVMVGTAAPGTLSMWAARNLMLSEARWPRRTQLSIEGFEDGVQRVARGADFTMRVFADTAGEVPETVRIQYWTEQEGWNSAVMQRLGDAKRSGEARQEFAYRFAGVLSSVDLDVRGGDARLRDLRLEVVPSPALADMRLECRYPSYTELAMRELPVTGVMAVPVGTEVVLLGEANKPLRRVAAEARDASASEEAEKVHMVEMEPASTTVEMALGVVTEDVTLALELTDASGITNVQPIEIILDAIEDEAPEVNVRVSGVSTAVTPNAVVPLAGSIRDDYGVEEAWLETTADGAGPMRHALGSAAGTQMTGSQVKVDVDEAFEVETLGLSPGRTLEVGAKAMDTYALGEAAHESAGERLRLAVVTPDTLRGMLESRELNLRRRFERIVAEVVESRDSVIGVSAGASTAEAAEGEEETISSAEVDRLRVQRARQNGQKNMSETAGVAESFESIRQELINNRVDTTELLSRLGDGIVDPLKTVAEVDFPRLILELEAVEEGWEDPERRAERLARSLVQYEVVLAGMQDVLERMLELETFNEVLEMLRSIVEAHDGLIDETRRARSERLRGLLDD